MHAGVRFLELSAPWETGFGAISEAVRALVSAGGVRVALAASGPPLARDRRLLARVEAVSAEGAATLAAFADDPARAALIAAPAGTSAPVASYLLEGFVPVDTSQIHADPRIAVS